MGAILSFWVLALCGPTGGRPWERDSPSRCCPSPVLLMTPASPGRRGPGASHRGGREAEPCSHGEPRALTSPCHQGCVLPPALPPTLAPCLPAAPLSQTCGLSTRELSEGFPAPGYRMSSCGSCWESHPYRDQGWDSQAAQKALPKQRLWGGGGCPGKLLAGPVFIFNRAACW